MEEPTANQQEQPPVPPASLPAGKTHKLHKVLVERDLKDYLGESALIIFSVVLALILTELINKFHEDRQTNEILKNLREEIATNERLETKQYAYHLQVMSNFSGSVAGLDVGADVTLHGLKIGEVTEVGLLFDPNLRRIVAPVRYRIDAERIAGIAAVKGMPPGTIAQEMVRRGFRAVLQAPSLISPGKIVPPVSCTGTASNPGGADCPRSLIWTIAPLAR